MQFMNLHFPFLTTAVLLVVSGIICTEGASVGSSSDSGGDESGDEETAPKDFCFVYGNAAAADSDVNKLYGNSNQFTSFLYRLSTNAKAKKWDPTRFRTHNKYLIQSYCKCSEIEHPELECFDGGICCSTSEATCDLQTAANPSSAANLSLFTPSDAEIRNAPRSITCRVKYYTPNDGQRTASLGSGSKTELLVFPVIWSVLSYSLLV